MLAEESLATARETGDVNATIYGLRALGEVTRMQGDRRRAMALLEEALTLARAQADPPQQARVLHWLGLTLGSDGDYPGARACWRGSRSDSRSHLAPSPWLLARRLCSAFCEQMEGNFERARPFSRRASPTVGKPETCRASAGSSPSSVTQSAARVTPSVESRCCERAWSCCVTWATASGSVGPSASWLCSRMSRGATARAVRLIGAAMRLIGDSQPEFLASERLDREAGLIAARSRPRRGGIRPSLGRGAGDDARAGRRVRAQGRSRGVAGRTDRQPASPLPPCRPLTIPPSPAMMRATWRTGICRKLCQGQGVEGCRRRGSMLAKTLTCAVVGLEGALVEVEVDIGRGCPPSTSWDCPTPRAGSQGGIQQPSRTRARIPSAPDHRQPRTCGSEERGASFANGYPEADPVIRWLGS